MANRTFWGFYQSNWRKWPSVAAAEQQAAYEAEHRQSPVSAAPSVVLPKPADEAREGNVSSRTDEGADGAESADEETDSPNDNIAAPYRTQSQPPAAEDKSLVDQKKSVLPESPSIRPALPGSNLDDPAPALPVDPNDLVPGLPPNLRDMKPPAEGSLDLDNLFKPPAIPTPKTTPQGEATRPRSNSPASANMTPAERTAEYIRRRREHAERNRKYMQEKYANAVIKPGSRRSDSVSHTVEQRAETSDAVANDGQAAAAANSASTADTLDELTALHRPGGTASAISTRSLASENASPAAKQEAGSPVEHSTNLPPATSEGDLPTETTPAESDEPQMLLSPTDTTAKNPLRENVEHARYAARMFTPQARSVDGQSSSTDLAGNRNAVNPLRSGRPVAALPRMNSLREVMPVSYEEELPVEPISTTNAAVQASPKELEVLTPEAEQSLNLSPVPVETATPLSVVPPEPLMQANAEETVREAVFEQEAWQRKWALESESVGNVLRESPGPADPRASANPLREANSARRSAAEARRVSLPAKTPGAGRYRAALATPADAEEEVRALEAESVAVPLSLGADNPLR
jgi:hypothetical protein